MAQQYSDPARADDKYALPDVETFYCKEGDDDMPEDCDGEPMGAGWYYWFCFPGCMPEGEPIGPFETEEDAVEDCRATFCD